MEQQIYQKRRIFINKNGKHFQIFTFSQKKDGSIYCSSPDFSDAKWISYKITKNGPELITAATIGKGKISFHGSGITGIRSNIDTEHTLRIKGNILLNKKQKSLGARHLFTVFMKEPQYLPPSSPAFNRKSDYALRANEVLQPFILIFFAIPKTGVSTHFLFNLYADEMNNIPNDFLGGHFISLRYHDIFWFAYRTKNLQKWPKYTHYSYHDGFTVPIFVGTKQQKFRLEFRQPTYSLINKNLIIRCVQEYKDS